MQVLAVPLQPPPLHDLTSSLSLVGVAVSTTSSPQSTVRSRGVTVPGPRAMPVTVHSFFSKVAVTVTERMLVLVVTVQVVSPSSQLPQLHDLTSSLTLAGVAVSSTSRPQLTVSLPLTVPRDVSLDRPVTVQPTGGGGVFSWKTAVVDTTPGEPGGPPLAPLVVTVQGLPRSAQGPSCQRRKL